MGKLKGMFSSDTKSTDEEKAQQPTTGEASFLARDLECTEPQQVPKRLVLARLSSNQKTCAAPRSPNK
jgi:hypothetical protein